MSYNSLAYFFVFLPVVIILYQLVPKKIRWCVLLLASYYFFFSISNKLIVYLLFTTLSIYLFGLWLKKVDDKCKVELEKTNDDERKVVKEKYKKNKKKILFLAVIIQVVILFIYKYLPFFVTNINSILTCFNIGNIKFTKLIAPIGISFYTLQALSYLIDIYNGKIEADKNLGRLALFMAFFPQIMEGPIARFSDTAHDLYEGAKITYKNLCFGLQRILWGVLKLYVIADRINPLVTQVFDKNKNLDGGIILFGAICYTILLYAEFSGTIDIIIGSGEIFGVKIPENFRQPFFSKNISEFWTRWHITLGAWLRDYIYYPVALSRKLKKLGSFLRKKVSASFGSFLVGTIALLVVWLLNGLWHGSDWNYIFYGIYHFVFILLGNVLEPKKEAFCSKHGINRKSIWYRILTFIKVFIIIIFGELFFRANGLKEGMRLFTSIFTSFSLKGFTSGKVLDLGVDGHDFAIVGVTLIIILIISILKEKNINIRESIANKNIIVRWSLYILLIMFIIIFGAYGAGYNGMDPIYANF